MQYVCLCTVCVTYIGVCVCICGIITMLVFHVCLFVCIHVCTAEEGGFGMTNPPTLRQSMGSCDTAAVVGGYGKNVMEFYRNVCLAIVAGM